MNICFRDDIKALPISALHRLFVLAGWSDGREASELLAHFNSPFLHSTLVVSAWIDDRLIGVARVLSDTIVRSELYDLTVDPEFRRQGIGHTLVERCMSHYPDSEWFLRTTPEAAPFYEKLGFVVCAETTLRRASKYF